MLKKMLTIVLVGMLMLVGITNVFAQDNGMGEIFVKDYGTIACFADGRVNAFDIDAPIAAYYLYETVPSLDKNGNLQWTDAGDLLYQDNVIGIEFLRYDNKTKQSTLVLSVSIDDMAALVASDDQSIAANGVTLNVGDNGWLWVTAARDNGAMYTFAWDDNGRLMPSEA